MTREEAIKHLEGMKIKIPIPKAAVQAKGNNEALNMAIEALEQTRWIPVSERLPETNDEMLVTYIVNGNHKKRYVETATYFDFGEEGEWNSVNAEYRIPGTKVEVIAWCELPEPYKTESEDKE